MLYCVFLDSMPSDKMSEIDNHLRSSVRELIDLESETTINVFFVYTTKNVPGLEEEKKLVHPGTVMEDLRKHSDLKLYVMLRTSSYKIKCGYPRN